MTIALALVVTTLASVAHAQDETARARALFDEASVARDEGRWSDAARLLERSLEIDPRFSTAWNLVTAYERTDDLVRAERLLEQIRDGQMGELDPAVSRSVEERLGTIASELATLVVLGPSERGAVLRLGGGDGAPLDARGRARLRVVPGAHVITLEASDGRRAETSVEVARGETRRVRIALASLPPVVPAEPATSTDDEGSIWDSPWLYVVLGGVLVAGGVLAALVLVDGPVRDPVQADFQPPPL